MCKGPKSIFNFSKIPFLYLAPIHTCTPPHIPHTFTPSVANEYSLSRARAISWEKWSVSDTSFGSLERLIAELQRSPSLKTYYITLHHRLHVTQSIAPMNTQFFTVCAQSDLLHKNEMIALPFPQEAWQGDKIFDLFLSNEVPYLHETGPSRAILARGIQ